MALARADVRWFVLAAPGSLAVAVVLGVGVALHRGPWLTEPFADLLLTRSIPLAVLFAVAWSLRGLGHGVVARRLAGRQGEEVAAPQWFAAFLGQALATVLTLVGGLLILPGLIAAGRLSVLPGLCIADGESLGQAVRSAFRTDRRSVWRAGAAWALLLLLWFVVTLNLVFGTIGLVGLLRILTGVDTTGLARLLDPTEPSTLLAAALLGFLVVDPLWALVRAVLFVERSDGTSGAGLERRWGRVLARGAGRVAALLALFLALVPFAGQAHADEPLPITDWAEHAWDGARELHAIADDWDGAETVLVSPLTTVLREQLGGRVEVPDAGPVLVDPAALLDGLPASVRTDGDVKQVRAVARRLESASVAARDVRTTAGEAPAHLLAAELAEGRYVLDDGPVAAAEAAPESLRERLQRWWEALWAGEPAEERTLTEPLKPPTVGGRVVVGIVAALAVVLVALVLVLAGRALARVGPGAVLLGDPPAAASDLPDPRSRAAALWAAEAEQLAGEGRYDDAIRSRFLAVLSHLDAAGAIQARPERTNGELVDGFRGSEAWRGFFTDAVRGYERAWFGPDPTQASDWVALRKTTEPLLPGARFEETP